MDSTAPSAPSWISGANERQRAAIEHGEGPLLILAGAGTGKTRTLVARLAHLIANGVPPSRILLVTFSRRAAEEMTRRAGNFTDPATARQVHAGTFHAMANRTLRTYGKALGLPGGFTVMDKSDAADLMQLVRNEQKHGRRKRFPRKDTLVSIYSRVVNAQQPLAEVLPRWYPWCAPDEEGISEVFTAYTERKRNQYMLDYDDLLLYWRAAASHPDLGAVLADQYDHILVDEYQDTNALQSDIIRALRRKNDNLTVVGDDAQSIYSFRAATVRNILDFGTHFPDTTTVTLDQNYRSTQPILELANSIIDQADEGFRKALWTDQDGDRRPILATCPDERAQSEAVCDTVLRHFEDGIPLKAQAVLFRAAHHSDALEVELRRRNIPFVKYGGLKFLEAAHVRDVLALLRILDNPHDELAWSRALQLADGVGPATVDRLLQDLGVRRQGDSSGSPLAQLSAYVQTEKGSRNSELRTLAEALVICSAGEASAGAQVDVLRRALEPMLRRRYDNAEARLRDLDQLSKLAAEYEDRSRLVAELTMDPPASTGDFAGPPMLDDDYLILSTVHSAKGAEWPVVHIVHAADGMFPSDMATGSTQEIDEERRLFYVAATRAKSHLHIYAPLRYHHSGAYGMGDAHSYAQRTRFLPPSVDHLLDHRAVRSPAADDPNAQLEIPDITISVTEALERLW